MSKRLSLILCSRDDDWEGNPDGSNRPIDRLRRTFDYIIPQLGDEDEVICVDWGSDPNLSISVNIPTVRFAHISPRICSKYAIPFNEVVALNHGVRLAEGEWIGHIDQDCLIGSQFFSWMNESGPKHGNFYWCGRRNMVEGQTTPTMVDYVDCYDDNPDYWKASTGIMLASKELWHRVRGFDERQILRNHIHHNLIKRMERSAKLVSIGSNTSYPFHHQWHRRDGHNSRPHNRQLDEAELNNLPEVVNGENWGLGDLL